MQGSVAKVGLLLSRKAGTLTARNGQTKATPSGQGQNRAYRPEME